MENQKIHKTFPVSEEEKSKIKLGDPSHVENTKAYADAKQFFEDEKKRLQASNCVIDSSSEIVITHTTTACKVDVSIYYTDTEENSSAKEVASDILAGAGDVILAPSPADVVEDTGGILDGVGEVLDGAGEVLGDVLDGAGDVLGEILGGIGDALG